MRGAGIPRNRLRLVSEMTPLPTNVWPHRCQATWALGAGRATATECRRRPPARSRRFPGLVSLRDGLDLSTVPAQSSPRALGFLRTEMRMTTQHVPVKVAQVGEVGLDYAGVQGGARANWTSVDGANVSIIIVRFRAYRLSLRIAILKASVAAMAPAAMPPSGQHPRASGLVVLGDRSMPCQSSTLMQPSRESLPGI